MEIMSWLEVLSVKNQAALSASSLILICYCIEYAINRKAVYMMAFLLCEFLGLSNILSRVNDIQFYLFYAIVYTLLYYYIYLKQRSTNILLACVVIMTFDIGMSLDAWLYPQTETIIYIYYEYLFIFVHLYLISSLINWQSLRLFMGQSIDNLLSLIGANYNLSFLLYNIGKTKHRNFNR